MPNILLVSATKLEHHDTEINGVPIHIIGIGKVEAALNTYKLIQKYKPDHVVNFGSCGSLCSARIGEVIEVGEVYDDFYGCVVPEHSSIKVVILKLNYLLQIHFMTLQQPIVIRMLKISVNVI